MGRKSSIIPHAPVGRILQNAGAKRVSATAVAAFSEILFNIAEEIGRQAVKIAKHAGRKTVQAEDVKLASR